MIEEIIEVKNLRGIPIRGVLTLPAERNSNKLVISIAGFEKSGTSEEKFKIFGKALAQKSLASFRFDFSGLGISEGEFDHVTVQRMAEEFCAFTEYFRQNFQIEEFKIITHSLGACVLAKSLFSTPANISQAILMAPALHQKELLRFWYTRKNVVNSTAITWENYAKFLDEDAFQKDMQLPGREGKSHWIASDYYQENANIDYTDPIIASPMEIMHIHGGQDDIVPIESLKLNSHRIIINNGDHELEKPNVTKAWLPPAVEFFTKV